MKIAIFGRTKAEEPEIIEKTKSIGKLIAKNKFTLVTGGTNGYPHIAALSSLEEGGEVIAYGVGKSMSDHTKFHNVDLSKYTEVIFQEKYFNKELLGVDNYLRSLHLCLNSDMAIVIGGRVGTMYEITILSGMAKNIFVLENSGGITKNTIKEFNNEGKKTNSKILFFNTIKELEILLKENS